MYYITVLICICIQVCVLAVTATEKVVFKEAYLTQRKAAHTCTSTAVTSTLHTWLIYIDFLDNGVYKITADVFGCFPGPSL